MLDLSKYDSLGAALGAALDQWPDEVCLIESDREREKERLTYRQFKEAALPLAAALQARGFHAGDRAAIIMTNQSKWLISAYAIFHSGGVLVPLDYKLTPREHLALLAHSHATVLVVEYPIWRAMMQAEGFDKHRIFIELVTEAPAGADLGGAIRWEEFRSEIDPVFTPRLRDDWACIVYSSGTGGRPKGCVLTHENYLEQCQSLTKLYAFWPGVRYLSILPTNHAIDFTVGFIGPFTCGATVVHLRTLRPEYVREAFTKYKITYMALVPLVLKNLQKGLQARFDALPKSKRAVFDALLAMNRAFTRRSPKMWLSRKLLSQVHAAFGGELRALFVGGAFTDPETLQFFYDLGIPVANGYGLTETVVAATLNDFRPFHPDSVGRALPGVEVRISNPDEYGVGEVTVRGKNVMLQYLGDPELTAETIVDGWLQTGDLGRISETGHLRLLGRKKNMIVTAEGKNIYPEDIENAFEGLPVKEFSVFATNFIWPERTMTGEELLIVLHPEQNRPIDDAVRAELSVRNQKLLNYKRISGFVIWDQDFPRTASMKVKRIDLAQQIRTALDRATAVVPL
jgi:long-chain acyl-CoA synthetase